LIVESVIAQKRGRGRLQPERGVQAPLIKRPKRGIGIGR
jgi:hypothetical protein